MSKSLLIPISGPNQQAQQAAGPLALPAAFDTNKYAARWAKEGAQADSLREMQRLLGTNLAAEGWQVWKHPNTKEPFRVALQSGAYILLFRSREVQEAVNAKFGELSRTRTQREKRGETFKGQAVPQGLLTEQDLPKEPGDIDDEDEPQQVATFNEETTSTEGVIARRGRRLNS